MIYPCHSKPKSQWCDHKGAGGFMGHTCIKKPNLLYLPLVAEEAAEVIQVAMKALRFGPDHRYPDGEHSGLTNMEALAIEVGNFLEVMELLGLQEISIEMGRALKREKLKKWGPER